MKGYKFRSFEHTQRDLETLMKDQIYASSFEDLNDPFEGFYKEEITRLARSLQTLFNVKSDPVIKALNAIKEFNSKLGIYSLSRTFSDELMWSHYASSHKGFCIEYDIEKLRDTSFKNSSIFLSEVIYQDDLPSITHEDIGSDTLVMKMFATKSIKWKYEQEVRLVYDNFGLKDYHFSALTGIYFGVKTPGDTKEKIIESLAGRDVKFFQALKSSDSYQIDWSLVHENHRVMSNSLDDDKYEILKTSHNRLIENFYVLYKETNLSESAIKNFCNGFREKHATKDCNINLFDDRSIQSMLGKFPLHGQEYIQYANHYFAFSPYDSPNSLIWYPCQDFKYKDLRGAGDKRKIEF